jgi:Flp pilus assembly protein TadD
LWCLKEIILRKIIDLLAADRQDAKAAAHYRQSVQWQPDQPEALNNFAWLLATSPEDQVRNGPQAVQLAERACALTQRQAPFLLGTLAAAYAEAGRFEEAIATAARARDLAREQKLEAVAVRNEELLQTYRAHQPHRERAP